MATTSSIISSSPPILGLRSYSTTTSLPPPFRNTSVHGRVVVNFSHLSRPRRNNPPPLKFTLSSSSFFTRSSISSSSSSFPVLLLRRRRENGAVSYGTPEPYYPSGRSRLTVVCAKGKGYKMKTHKASAKRFRVTGSGKIIRRRAGKQHLLGKKNTKRKLRLSKMVQVKRSDYNNVIGALPYLKVNRAK